MQRLLSRKMGAEISDSELMMVEALSRHIGPHDYHDDTSSTGSPISHRGSVDDSISVTSGDVRRERKHRIVKDEETPREKVIQVEPLPELVPDRIPSPDADAADNRSFATLSSHDSDRYDTEVSPLGARGPSRHRLSVFDPGSTQNAQGRRLSELNFEPKQTLSRGPSLFALGEVDEEAKSLFPAANDLNLTSIGKKKSFATQGNSADLHAQGMTALRRMSSFSRIKLAAMGKYVPEEDLGGGFLVTPSALLSQQRHVAITTAVKEVDMSRKGDLKELGSPKKSETRKSVSLNTLSFDPEFLKQLSSNNMDIDAASEAGGSIVQSVHSSSVQGSVPSHPSQQGQQVVVKDARVDDKVEVPVAAVASKVETAVHGSSPFGLDTSIFAEMPAFVPVSKAKKTPLDVAIRRASKAANSANARTSMVTRQSMVGRASMISPSRSPGEDGVAPARPQGRKEPTDDEKLAIQTRLWQEAQEAVAAEVEKGRVAAELEAAAVKEEAGANDELAGPGTVPSSPSGRADSPSGRKTIRKASALILAPSAPSPVPRSASPNNTLKAKRGKRKDAKATSDSEHEGEVVADSAEAMAALLKAKKKKNRYRGFLVGDIDTKKILFATATGYVNVNRNTNNDTPLGPSEARADLLPKEQVVAEDTHKPDHDEHAKDHHVEKGADALKKRMMKRNSVFSAHHHGHIAQATPSPDIAAGNVAGDQSNNAGEVNSNVSSAASSAHPSPIQSSRYDPIREEDKETSVVPRDSARTPLATLTSISDDVEHQPVSRDVELDISKPDTSIKAMQDVTLDLESVAQGQGNTVDRVDSEVNDSINPDTEDDPYGQRVRVYFEEDSLSSPSPVVHSPKDNSTNDLSNFSNNSLIASARSGDSGSDVAGSNQRRTLSRKYRSTKASAKSTNDKEIEAENRRIFNLSFGVNVSYNKSYKLTGESDFSNFTPKLLSSRQQSEYSSDLSSIGSTNLLLNPAARDSSRSVQLLPLSFPFGLSSKTQDTQDSKSSWSDYYARFTSRKEGTDVSVIDEQDVVDVDDESSVDRSEDQIDMSNININKHITHINLAAHNDRANYELMPMTGRTTIATEQSLDDSDASVASSTSAMEPQPQQQQGPMVPALKRLSNSSAVSVSTIAAKPPCMMYKLGCSIPTISLARTTRINENDTSIMDNNKNSSLFTFNEHKGNSDNIHLWDGQLTMKEVQKKLMKTPDPLPSVQSLRIHQNSRASWEFTDSYMASTALSGFPAAHSPNSLGHQNSQSLGVGFGSASMSTILNPIGDNHQSLEMKQESKLLLDFQKSQITATASPSSSLPWLAPGTYDYLGYDRSQFQNAWEDRRATNQLTMNKYRNNAGGPNYSDLLSGESLAMETKKQDAIKACFETFVEDRIPSKSVFAAGNARRAQANAQAAAHNRNHRNHRTNARAIQICGISTLAKTM
jgi:hypothetical protein